VVPTQQAKTFEYTVSLSRERGRLGQLAAGERTTILTAPPEDFPAGDERRWSPEHLFLGALQSCTMLSFLAHAEHNGLPVRDYDSEIEGTVMRRAEDGRYAFVFIRHKPTVTVPPGQRDAARAIIGKAERDCFVSASINAEIQVDWEIKEE
jgi:organic hydroperoxide reductase OsmC/OhrA